MYSIEFKPDTFTLLFKADMKRNFYFVFHLKKKSHISKDKTKKDIRLPDKIDHLIKFYLFRTTSSCYFPHTDSGAEIRHLPEEQKT